MEPNDIVIDFSYLSAVAKRHRIAILVGMLIGLLAGLVVFITLPSPYTTEAKIIPAQEGGGANGAADLLDNFTGAGIVSALGGSGSTEETFNFEYLRSNTFAGKFIEKYHIDGILFPDKWDQQTMDWKVALDDEERPSAIESIKKFKGLLSIDSDRRTRVITINFSGADASTVAKITNDLIDFANKLLKRKAIIRTEAQQQYLNRLHVQENMQFRRKLIQHLIEKNLAQLTVVNSSDDYAFRIIDPAFVPDSQNHTFNILLALLLIIGGTATGFLYALYRARGETL